MSKKFLSIYNFKKNPKNFAVINTYSYDIEKLFNFPDKHLFKKKPNEYNITKNYLKNLKKKNIYLIIQRTK